MEPVGRGAERQACRSGLGLRGAQLVVGPPGIGKTTLARACAAKAGWATREWDLRAIPSLAELGPWLAREAGLPARAPQDAVDGALVAQLEGAGVDLLHVEAFELGEGAVARLRGLARPGRLRVLVCARRAGGADLRLKPLGPAAARRMVAQEALRELSPEAVEHVVARSGGLPLLIRLLTRFVSLTEVPKGPRRPRLRDFARPLTDAYAEVARRLDADAARAWARLSGFAGAFEEAHVRALGVGPEALAELRAWSLVEPRRERGGSLGLLDSAREFAWESFERGALEDARRRHRDLCLALVHELALLPFGPPTAEAFARADARRADLALALARCPGDDPAAEDLCLALDLLDDRAFPEARQSRLERTRVAMAAVGRPIPPALLNREAAALADLGRLAEAEAMQRRALERVAEATPAWEGRIRADSLLLLVSDAPEARQADLALPDEAGAAAQAYAEMRCASHALSTMGPSPDALAHTQRATQLARQAGHERLEVAVLGRGAPLLVNLAPPQADALLARARRLAEAHGLTMRLAEAWGATAIRRLDTGEADACEQAFREAVDRFEACGFERGRVVHLGYWGLADLWFRRGDPVGKLQEAAVRLRGLGLPAASILFQHWLLVVRRLEADGRTRAQPEMPARSDLADAALPKWERRLLEQLHSALAVGEVHDAERFEQLAREADAIPYQFEARFIARLARRLAEQRFRYLPDGFSNGGGRVIRLTHRPVLSRLYGALYEAASAEPGKPVSFERIAARVWPQEQASAGNRQRKRVHSNVWELRELGLRQALGGDERGYWLDLELGRVIAPRRGRR